MAEDRSHESTDVGMLFKHVFALQHVVRFHINKLVSFLCIAVFGCSLQSKCVVLHYSVW